MFSIGDLVVHPMHGAGVIDDIVQEKVAGVMKEYYVFKMPVLNALPDLTVEANANWNKRYQENLMRLKSGDLYQVARVIKSLMQRDSLRGLSTGERKMLHNAKQIMISEIVMAEKVAYREVETRIDHAMMQLPVPQ